MSLIFKTIRTPLGYYVFDRETNSLLKVSEEEYQSLENMAGCCPSEADWSNVERFRTQGFFPESKLSRIEHSATESVAFQLENKVERITLQVTQQCNLRCAYCAYSGLYHQRTHSDQTMSLDVMKKSVDFLIRHSGDMEKVHIGFYGGEPLLEFPKLKELIQYVEKEYYFKNIEYGMTTNGTVFTDEIIRFLDEHKVQVTISLDGPKEIHNISRKFMNGKGSFDTIMKKLLEIKEQYPEFFRTISFNAVTAPGTEFRCVNEFFNASDVIQDNLIMTSTVNPTNLKEGLRYDDLYFRAARFQQIKLLLSKLGLYSSHKVSRLFTISFSRVSMFHQNLGKFKGLPQCAHPGGPCVPGVQRPFVDIHGNLFPCERVSETSQVMNIGHIDTGFRLDQIREILNIGRLTERECIDCWNFVNCQQCASFADGGEALSREKRLKACASSRQTTLDHLQTICLLKEYGYVFDQPEEFVWEESAESKDSGQSKEDRQFAEPIRTEGSL